MADYSGHYRGAVYLQYHAGNRRDGQNQGDARVGLDRSAHPAFDHRLGFRQLYGRDGRLRDRRCDSGFHSRRAGL